MDKLTLESLQKQINVDRKSAHILFIAAGVGLVFLGVSAIIQARDIKIIAGATRVMLDDRIFALEDETDISGK